MGKIEIPEIHFSGSNEKEAQDQGTYGLGGRVTKKSYVAPFNISCKSIAYR